MVWVETIGKQWYRKLDKYITENAGKRTSADPCLYKFGEAHDRVILVIYVDDLLLASKNLKTIESIKSKMKSTFKI